MSGTSSGAPSGARSGAGRPTTPSPPPPHREGTNRTHGQENYDIDTQNTDPSKGRTSNDPNSYDDKELFNLL